MHFGMMSAVHVGKIEESLLPITEAPLSAKASAYSLPSPEGETQQQSEFLVLLRVHYDTLSLV